MNYILTGNRLPAAQHPFFSQNDRLQLETTVDFLKFLSKLDGIQELCRGAPVENNYVDMPSWEGGVLSQIQELTLFPPKRFGYLLTS